MSLFSKLKLGAKKPNSDPLTTELAAIAKDGRMHARTRLHDETVATLTLPTGLAGRVVDVSYGGIAAVFNDASFPLKPSMQADGVLSVLGQQVKLRMTTVRAVNHGPQEHLIGFCLHHEVPEGLLFLRDFIEPARAGETLSLINPDLRQSRYQGKDWYCWRGDGPTDLIAQTLPGQAELAEALLTFRLNKHYCELTYKQGRLKTGLIRNEDDPSLLNGTARAASSAGTDEQRVLRAGTYILMASPLLCRVLTAPIIAQARQQLSLFAGTAVQAKQA